MSKIKICGLRTPRDIDYVNELKPDYIGFILADGFGRSISRETAAKLRSRLDGGIKAVGVFVNDSAEKIASFLSQGIIDIVQLHGNESPEFCKAVNAPVIKYLKCEKGIEARTAEYGDAADFLLFDSGTGTGNTFDWSAIPKTETPFFLAGGLGPENLKRAIEEVDPYAVDLSSSVETNGQKDYYKIKKVMEIVRNE